MKITGTKDKYEVGDVVVAEFGNKECIVKIKSVSVMVDDLYLVDFLEFPIKDIEVMLYHYDILGLAETTDNESKDNGDWIMVDSELPDTNKPIFFVFETGIMLIGYFSEVSGNFIAYTVPNLYLAYQPKQVIKWQYVKFPKI